MSEDRPIEESAPAADSTREPDPTWFEGYGEFVHFDREKGCVYILVPLRVNAKGLEREGGALANALNGLAQGTRVTYWGRRFDRSTPNGLRISRYLNGIRPTRNQPVPKVS